MLMKTMIKVVVLLMMMIIPYRSDDDYVITLFNPGWVELIELQLEWMMLDYVFVDDDDDDDEEIVMF